MYKQSGPIHKPIFKVEVQIKNSKKLSGEGSTKKNAQQNAAKKLLTSLDIKCIGRMKVFYCPKENLEKMQI